jgi:hypothetical protein
MPPFDHLVPATAEQCQRELARILATGLLRALGRLPIQPEAASVKNSQNSTPPSLAISPHKSVTVHTG